MSSLATTVTLEPNEQYFQFRAIYSGAKTRERGQFNALMMLQGLSNETITCSQKTKKSRTFCIRHEEYQMRLANSVGKDFKCLMVLLFVKSSELKWIKLCPVVSEQSTSVRNSLKLISAKLKDTLQPVSWKWNSVLVSPAIASQQVSTATQVPKSR